MTQKTSSTGVGRPRSFDEHAALTAAMEAFWASGFTRTSYQQIEDATKLRRQSLIYAFGDKRELFRKALALYAKERVDEIVGILRGPGSPIANIEAVFASWLTDVDHGARRGCLMVNTAGELGRTDPVAAGAIATATDRLRRAFSVAFTKAQQAGEIGEAHDPEDLACLAVAAGDGALLHARASGDDGDAVRAFAGLIKLLQK